MSDFTPEETAGLVVDDLVIVGRGRVIWRVKGFWRSGAGPNAIVFASLQRTDRLDVRRSVDPVQCRLLQPRGEVAPVD